MRTPKESSAAPAIELHSLTPEYVPDKHSVYFDALSSALQWTGQRKVRNVALTGSYGVGKSSILQRVASDTHFKSIQISLSTLGFEGASEATAGEKVGRDSRPANASRDTKTNQIQKEIVKQLLYTQMPHKMPGSRYRRSAAFSAWREVAVALVAGTVLAIVSFLFGWTGKLAGLLLVPTEWAIGANVSMVILASVLVLGVLYRTHNRLRIDSVTAGAATIALSAKSDTYFDEYLDEIVYFFQVVKSDIVIFEDIDRFEDPYIFESLRELNTILNAAKQLNGRTIRFVYAIKDSIFEELGVRSAQSAGLGLDAISNRDVDIATLEIARANRTKFFDLVIPVVPFVTHQSARELMSSELIDLKHEISEDLIDLVAQHVADMRLIKNIRNEFVIFREQIIRKSSLELSDDHLFAMILYKSTHLSDFERVKLGTSNLDILYRESRDLVSARSASLNAELVSLHRQVRVLNNKTREAQRIGALVEEYIDTIVGHVGYPLAHLQFGTSVIPPTDLYTPDLWEKYVGGDEALSFALTDSYRGIQVSDLTRSELEKVTRSSLDPNLWGQGEIEDLHAQIDTINEQIAFLSHADMADLMARTDVVDSEDQTFSFRVHQLLGSKLALQLVGQGYIDRYFTLYTSIFPGDRVNANAMNFILKNVDADSSDFHFKLTAEESRSILRERPRLALNQRSAYNLDLLAYLLKDAALKSSLSIVIENLERNGAPEKQFLQAFFAARAEAPLLARALAQHWNKILVVIVEQIEVDESGRLKVFDEALRALDPQIDYEVSSRIAAYLTDHLALLSAFTGKPASADALARLLQSCAVDVPQLAPLSSAVKDAVVAAERFTVTRENVLEATGASEILPLDALRSAAPPVYQRVLRSINQYVSLLRGSEQTISDPTLFVKVLEEIDKVDRAALNGVVALSAAKCRVDYLKMASAGTWPSLAVNSRFSATFANVEAYIDQWGVDQNLAAVLQAGVIEGADDVPSENKVKIAEVLIGSDESLLHAQLRTSLAASLNLADWLAPDVMPSEYGMLVGGLIEQRIISDSAESFLLLIEDDWEGLEYAISVSNELPSFIDPRIIKPGLMIRFLESVVVAPELKRSVLERFVEFSSGADSAVVAKMAEYVLDEKVKVGWEALERISSARVGEVVVLKLLRRFSLKATIDQLRPILAPLGPEYTALLAANGLHPKFTDTPEVRALLERMRTLGTVSTFNTVGTKIKVNMKRN